MSEQQFPGRLLGIDHGLKIIGLAISDPTGLIARPLGLIHRTSKRADFAQIEAIIQAQAIAGGYTQADRVQLWASRLASAISVPVYLWNERYSTQEAEELLTETRQERPERVDAVAAAVILQSFLNTIRDEGIPWPAPVSPVPESDADHA